LLEECLSFLSLPLFDWIQVEVTSHCNASCGYCPRTVYRDTWLDRHMTLETFQRLLPAFRRTRLVYLQGWGEPFLHPDLLAMVALAKRAGCRVGTTTNGMSLDTETLRGLVESGVDVVAFSLAGIDERNDAIRQGTSLARVLATIRELVQIKRKLASKLPELHIAYMLLRSGLGDVARLPDALRGLGVSEVVISTLDLVASQELMAETIKPANESEFAPLQAQLDAVKVEGERFGLRIHSGIYRPGERGSTCTENIQRALFVSADGTVSACVYANLPVSKPVPMACHVRPCYERVVLGNVGQAPLRSIWRSRAYRKFRQAFEQGQTPAMCEGCPKPFIYG
jgi:MoaA/NifB/PqqE/SkfB family radical SAM enzyme